MRQKITTAKYLTMIFVARRLFEFILKEALVVNLDIVREAREPPLH